MTPHSGLTLKRPAEVPVDSLVRLVRSYEESVTGEATCTRDDIVLETSHPGYADNSWCLAGPDGDLVAWAALTLHGAAAADCALTALPGEHGESAARTLLALLLDRVDALGAEHGTRYTVTVGGLLGGDPVVPPVLEQAGFVRRSTVGQYEVDLAEEPLPPLLPDDSVLRQAGPKDTEVLHALHLRRLGKGLRTEDPQTFALRLAQVEQAGGVTLLLETAGRPTGYVLAQATTGTGRILGLAVSPASRGLGIGLALVTAALAELRTRGCARATVSLDTAELHDPEALARVLGIRGSRAVSRYVRAA